LRGGKEATTKGSKKKLVLALRSDLTIYGRLANFETRSVEEINEVEARGRIKGLKSFILGGDGLHEGTCKVGTRGGNDRNRMEG